MDEPEKKPLAESIEDGSYYVAARHWYSDIFHTPIAERSYYIIVLLLASLSTYYSSSAFMSIFPLDPPVGFNIIISDIWTEVPQVDKLAPSSRNKNFAVMDYLVRNYVTNRESYDYSKLSFRYRNIWSNSSGPVFEGYKKQVDPHSAASPYGQYTNLKSREVDIISVDYDPDLSHAHVVFREHVKDVRTHDEIQETKWKADITYKYTDFHVDQKLNSGSVIASLFGLTGKGTGGSGDKSWTKPVIVTDYQVKEMLE